MSRATKKDTRSSDYEEPKDPSSEPMLEGGNETENTQPKKCCGCVWNWKMKGLLAIVIIASLGATAACLFRNPTIFQYPMHASCNITWTFRSNCQEVSKRLLNQIEVWKTDATCGSGQKCLYGLEGVNGNVIRATHTTPVRKYIDDLTFTFYPNSATGGCNVLGFSTSRIWYAVLDYGTNYCNLHNLVDGAGLRADELYSELTRDEICTQYTSSNCEKY